MKRVTSAFLPLGIVCLLAAAARAQMPNGNAIVVPFSGTSMNGSFPIRGVMVGSCDIGPDAMKVTLGSLSLRNFSDKDYPVIGISVGLATSIGPGGKWDFVHGAISSERPVNATLKPDDGYGLSNVEFSIPNDGRPLNLDNCWILLKIAVSTGKQIGYCYIDAPHTMFIPLVNSYEQYSRPDGGPAIVGFSGTSMKSDFPIRGAIDGNCEISPDNVKVTLANLGLRNFTVGDYRVLGVSVSLATSNGPNGAWKRVAGTESNEVPTNTILKPDQSFGMTNVQFTIPRTTEYIDLASCWIVLSIKVPVDNRVGFCFLHTAHTMFVPVGK